MQIDEVDPLPEVIVEQIIIEVTMDHTEKGARS